MLSKLTQSMYSLSSIQPDIDLLTYDSLLMNLHHRIFGEEER